MGTGGNSAEINPQMHCGQVIYDKDLKNTQWGKHSLFNKCSGCRLFPDHELDLSPALTGRFFTTEPPGKPPKDFFFLKRLLLLPGRAY